MNSRKNINEIGANDYIRRIINSNYSFDGICHKVDNLIPIVKSFEEKNEQDKVLCNSVSSILFLDSYKILANKVKKGIADDFEMIDYNDLSSLTSFEELKKLYENDMSYLLLGYKSTNDFINLPSLTKINIIKNLSKEENERLNLVTSFHQNDLDKYDIPVDKDYLYDFYRKYNRYLSNKRNVTSIKPIVVLISNYIKDSYYLNPQEAKGLIGSISSDVFDHIESFSKLVPSNITVFDTLAKEYQEDSNGFSRLCIFDQDVMELVLGTYFLMKDIKLIKGKTYDKK